MLNATISTAVKPLLQTGDAFMVRSRPQGDTELAGAGTSENEAKQNFAVVVSISPEARSKEKEKNDTSPGQNQSDQGNKLVGNTDLRDADVEQLRKLQARDREVRAHEAAHQASGGGLAGGARYKTQKGPDGKDYAVGGEVSIDVSPGRTPSETITKAQHVRAAALAPADPSPQDRAVAAMATQMETQARQQQLQMDQARRDVAEVARQQAQAELDAENSQKQQSGQMGSQNPSSSHASKSSASDSVSKLSASSVRGISMRVIAAYLSTVGQGS